MADDRRLRPRTPPQRQRKIQPAAFDGLRDAYAAVDPHLDAHTRMRPGESGERPRQPGFGEVLRGAEADRAGDRGALQRRQRLVVEREDAARIAERSEEHTSELQSLMRISYAGFC